MSSTYTDNSGKPTILKDPDSELDYPFDWTDWLEVTGDSIAAVEFIAQAPLEITSSSNDAKTAVAWVRGGGPVTIPPKTLSLTCRITTDSVPPRTEDRTVYLKIKDR